MDRFRAWFQRTFSNPQVVILAFFVLLGLLIIYGFGRMLGPALAALVIAYLLEAVVIRLERFGIPRLAAVILVFLVFLVAVLFLMFGLGPILSRQLTQLVQQLPNYIQQGRELLLQLPEAYPQLSPTLVEDWVNQLGAELAEFGQKILTWSLASVLNIVSLLVLAVLVPVLVFFFLKDKEKLQSWLTGYLPKDRELVTSVWHEVDIQIGNYVRGKALEILIVGAVTYVVFSIMDLQYAALLATLVGFSVLIPYIGAAVATLPVALVAFFQFGWGWDFSMVVIAYMVIQFLDGNVLVPLLFSEVVNLHPVAIILAILIFGGLWGFWGIFFAIPLATLVNAILRAWPRAQEVAVEADAES